MKCQWYSFSFQCELSITMHYHLDYMGNNEVMMCLAKIKKNPFKILITINLVQQSLNNMLPSLRPLTNKLQPQEVLTKLKFTLR